MADTKTNDRAIPKSRDRAILDLAIPSVIASLSVPVIGIVDTVLVGHLDEVYMLGAVSVGAVVFDVIFWGLGFFRMGTTALVAQAYGAKDFAGCRSILLMSAAMAGLLGILLLLLRDLIGDLGFGLAGPTDEVTHWGRLYLNIRILGAPFVLITFVMTGFLRGCGDVISPLIITVVVNLVNVGLDFVLIYGHLGAPAMGVVGAAWASAVAGFVGSVLGGVLVFYRHRSIIGQKGRIFDPVRARQVVTTNGYLFGRTACLLFTQFIGMAVVSRMGDTPSWTRPPGRSGLLSAILSMDSRMQLNRSSETLWVGAIRVRRLPLDADVWYGEAVSGWRLESDIWAASPFWQTSLRITLLSLPRSLS